MNGVTWQVGSGIKAKGTILAVMKVAVGGAVVTIASSGMAVAFTCTLSGSTPVAVTVTENDALASTADDVKTFVAANHIERELRTVLRFVKSTFPADTRIDLSVDPDSGIGGSVVVGLTFDLTPKEAVRCYSALLDRWIDFARPAPSLCIQITLNMT